PIQITFSKPMDTTATLGAIRILNLDDSSDVTIQEHQWSGDLKEITMRVWDPEVTEDTTGLDFLTNYEVKILGTACDTAGMTLDGNKNGKPEGSPEDDYVFTFKTREPRYEISCSPFLSKIKVRQSRLIKIIVENWDVRTIDPIQLSTDAPNDPNWSVSGADPSLVAVPAGGTAEAVFQVINYGEPGSIIAEVKGVFRGVIERFSNACVWAYKPEQQYSEPHPPPPGPDENYSITNHKFPDPWIFNPQAKVGIFLSGYAECIGHLLGKYNIASSVVLDNFEILGARDRSISDLDVLFIPTGGLYSYSNLPTFREKLDEYVRNGGTLVCFTQPKGEDFNALPGSPEGFGWTEDESCHLLAAYLNLWKTYCSGLDTVTYDGNMDGYLTNYPPETDALLIRIANGFPAFISYPYGKGKVILTTGYPDFAYRQRSQLRDEARLCRDLMTILAIPDTVPEYYADTTITPAVKISYPSYLESIPANRAEVRIYYPNRESLRVDNLLLTPPMLPGDERVITLASLTTPESLGIYPICYTLYQDTARLTDEEFGGGFAVKTDIKVGEYNLGDVQMWVTVLEEEVLWGQPAEFDVYIRNNTEDTIFSRLLIGDRMVYPIRIIYDDTISNISIPPETIVKVDYERDVSERGLVYFSLFSSDTTIHRRIAHFSKYIQVKWPRISLRVVADSLQYHHHSTATIKMSYYSNFTAVDTFTVSILKEDSLVYKICDTIFHEENLWYSETLNYYLDPELPPGRYDIQATAYYLHYKWWTSYYSFLLIGPTIKFASVIPDTVITGFDTTRFVVEVYPEKYVCPSNTLSYWLTIPSGIPGVPADTVFRHDVVIDSLHNGDTLIAPFTIDSLPYGHGGYSFGYTLKSIDKLSGSYGLRHYLWWDLAFLGGSYRWEDTLNIALELKYQGNFLQPISIILDVEKGDTCYYDSTVFLTLGLDTVLKYRVPIDSGIPSGEYQILARVWFGDKVKEIKKYYTVQAPVPARIICALDSFGYEIGDSATLIIHNMGELEADVRLDDMNIQGPGYYYQSLEGASYTIPGGGFAHYRFEVPTVMTGTYYLQGRIRELNFNQELALYERFDIHGIDADLALTTDKDFYLDIDSVGVEFSARNHDYHLSGDLTLEIKPYILHPDSLTLTPGDSLWQVYPEVCKGCTIKNGRMTLLGYDRLYEVDIWNFSEGDGRDGGGVLSRRALIKKLLRDKRGGGRDGGRGISYTALASYGCDLYMAMSAETCRIKGPYPDWSESYDLPGITSIFRFVMDGQYFYIVDKDGSRLYKVDRTGSVVKSWPLSAPYGIGIEDNYLYLVDQGNHQVVKFTTDGDTVLLFGADHLSRPADLAVRSGVIYVSDLDLNKVLTFDVSGNYRSEFAIGRFSVIEVDDKGYLYGYDLDSANIAKFDEQGNLIERYPLSSDDICAADTLIHSAKVYTSITDYITGYVLINYGRNKGFTETEMIFLPGLDKITDFQAFDNPHGGDIDYRFGVWIGVNGFKVYFPIDSIYAFNFRPHANVLYRADLTLPNGGIPPEIEKLKFSYLSGYVGPPVWSDYVSLSIEPDDSILIERNAGLMPDTGEYALWGDLFLSSGQRYYPIPEHHFYVGPTELSLGIKSDYERYYPDEDIQLSILAANSSDSLVSGLSLRFFKRESLVIDTTLDLYGNSVETLSVTLSDTATFEVVGLLFREGKDGGSRFGIDTIRASKYLLVEPPPVDYQVSYPETVSHDSFDVTIDLRNHWEREVEIVVSSEIGGIEYVDTVFLYPEATSRLEHRFAIDEDDTLTIRYVKPGCLGARSYPIIFGERISVLIDTIVTSEPQVPIPYRVVNTGFYPVDLELSLRILDSLGISVDSTTVKSVVPIGDTVGGEFGTVLDYGDYLLSYIGRPVGSPVILDSGSVPIRVIVPDRLTISDLYLHPRCDSSGNIVIDLMIRNHSANPFFGNVKLSGSFINETKEIDIPGLDSVMVTFTSDAILSQGYEPVTGEILKNGEVIFERIDSLYFEPMFVIDSLPQGLSFGVGDTALIIIPVSNRGNALGQVRLRVDFDEIGEIEHLIQLVPAEVRPDTFTFVIPVDLEEKTYYAWVWLDDEEYVLPVKILGYKVDVTASLNKPYYFEGDTVDLTLRLRALNERLLKGFVVASYAGENLTSDFYLTGMVRGIDLSDPDLIGATADTGLYISSVIMTGGFDSLKVSSVVSGEVDLRTRLIDPDSIHYSAWYRDTVIGIPGDLIQFKVHFHDTTSLVDRVLFDLYKGDSTWQVVVDSFEEPKVDGTFRFPFEPGAGSVFYGIYTETGRGLYLNTIRVYEGNDTINLILDRMVYEMGDTVDVEVITDYDGLLKYRVEFYPYEPILDSIWIDTITNEFTFILPEELVSGSYEIDYSFFIEGDTTSPFSSTHPFDVYGYSIQVVDCRLDTTVYEPHDTMAMRLKVGSNRDLESKLKIGFYQGDDYYPGPEVQVEIDSGFNLVDLEMVMPVEKRGPASLRYTFYRDSLWLSSHQEGFVVHIPDSIPPEYEIVRLPEDTYDPTMEHEVVIVATDETRITDSLYYHDGITWHTSGHRSVTGDTITYLIPAQPRATNLNFYIVLEDSFGNTSRVPDVDYFSFWVNEPLPPVELTGDTAFEYIGLNWSEPGEILIYDHGLPSVITDNGAVRITPQYLPSALIGLDLYLESETVETTDVLISFYEVVDGEPGDTILPSIIQKIPIASGWNHLDLDSILLPQECYLAISFTDSVYLFGDGDSGAFRTRVLDTTWQKIDTLGNILLRPELSYPSDSLYFYRVLRRDTGVFELIADSLSAEGLTDTSVAGEKRYQYLVQAHYPEPGLNGTSPILEVVYDYTPPVYGDSLIVIPYPDRYLIGAEITDGIGVMADSLVYDTLTIGSDSIGDLYWYTIPYEGREIKYYLFARDSAYNLARNPDTGHYIIPGEGISGHITHDTTWATDVYVVGDVTIDDGATLTILSGVVVEFAPFRDDEHGGIDSTLSELIVEGEIDPDSGVVFTCEEQGGWYGIRLLTKTKKITGFELRSARCGLSYYLGRPITFKELTVTGCDTGVVSSSWITQVRSCRIDSNRIGVVINDGIFNRLKSCSFSGNGVGLLVRGFVDGGEGINPDPPNSKGLIVLEQPQSEVRTPEQIPNSERELLFRPIDKDCGMALVLDNAFAENDTGIVFTDFALALVKRNDLIGDGIGIYIDDSWPILGIGMCGKNRIISESYSVYNNSPYNIKAEGNYWGTTDPDSIGLKIYDHYDDPSLGIVDFEPYWDGVEAFAGGPQAGAEAPLPLRMKPIPSPSVGGVTIEYQTLLPREVKIAIFDPSGRQVWFWVEKGVGYHRITKGLPTGVYFLRLEAKGVRIERKVVIID
ncbi:hypothetical protein DRP53_01675, partial [candidate division WOR-3 bacterium]